MLNKLRHHRFPRWLVLFALVFQLVMSAEHFSAMAAGESTSLKFNPDGTHTLIICNFEGIKRITLDADGNIVSQTKDIQQNETTSLCHFGGSLFEEELNVPFGFRTFSSRMTSGEKLHAQTLLVPMANWLSPHKRAPPQNS